MILKLYENVYLQGLKQIKLLIYQKEYSMRINCVQNSRILSVWQKLPQISTDLLQIISECRFYVEQVLREKQILRTYLYWSYAQWNNVSPYSDLDIIIFFDQELSESEKQAITNSANFLTKKYKRIFAYIGIDIATPKLYQSEQPLVYSLLTRHMWIHCFWKSMSDTLPMVTLDKNLGHQLNSDFIDRIENKMNEYLAMPPGFQKQLVCRWIMKKMIRTSFGLIIEQLDYFENDVHNLILILIKFYPAQKLILRKMAQIVESPIVDNVTMIYILNIYFTWLRQEWCRVYTY